MSQGQKIGLGAAVLLLVAIAAFSTGALVAQSDSSPEAVVAAEATTSTTEAEPTTTATTAPTTTTTAPTTTVPPTTQTPTTTTTTLLPPPTTTVPAGLTEWSTAYAALRAELNSLPVDPNSSDPCALHLGALQRFEPQLVPAPTPLLAQLITRYTSELGTMYTRCLAQQNSSIEASQAILRMVHSEIVGAIHSAGGTYDGS